ncbi:MAG: serine protein kinase RIO [archaeon]|jgi:RIO kinase 1
MREIEKSKTPERLPKKFVETMVKDDNTRRIFNDVFDGATIAAVHELARKKYFDAVEFVVSTGKEGNVFRCKGGKNYYALKIYKIETSDFNRMQEYIIGDERFKNVRKGKLETVIAWTKKEFKNLTEFKKAGIRTPNPIIFKRNCLLMEFIGSEGEAAPTAKEKPFAEPEKQYEKMCEYLAKMIEAKLVHADLSEYNILNDDEEMVIIDAGQAVSTLHPKAKEFFERDIRNLSKWFAKKGVATDFEKMYEKIKAKTKEKKETQKTSK